MSQPPYPSRVTPLRSTWLACLAALAWLCTASAARAEDTYEWRRTQRVLDDNGWSLASLPEGKRIAWVKVVRDDIFVDDEKWPLWFNVFHKTTREKVVRRELLFAQGEAYDNKLIEETMRNLRGMGIFALVRIVPVAIDDPDAVGVLVHTRDVWSLRLEEDLSIDRQVNLLHLVLIERNLAGLNYDVSTSITLIPDKYTLGESYTARRFLGSKIRVSQYQGIILGRLRPGAEGSLGGLAVSQPLYRLANRVTWSVSGDYDVRVVRNLDANGQPQVYEAPDGQTAKAVYDSRIGVAQALGAYRFGDEVKIALGGGAYYNERLRRPNGETMLPPDIAEDFARDVLPASRRDVGPRFYYDMFLARFRILNNVGTYGQSENVRVGPRVYLGVSVPIAAFGSTYDAMVLTGLFETVHTGGKGLFSLSVQGNARLQQGQIIDQRLLSQLRFATPTFGPIPLRLVSRLAADLRANDSQNTFVSLGSNNGLRGYAARSFSGRGESRLLANVELRSLPWKLGSLHLGGVIFYDVGTVFSNIAHTKLHHAVGVGLRFVFPQFNRYPFSFDVGFPVDPGFRLTPSLITPTLTSAQVVPITANDEDTFP